MPAPALARSLAARGALRDITNTNLPPPAKRGAANAAAENTATVEEYLVDMRGALARAERGHGVRAGHMAAQPDLNSGMRAILVDWLMEVHETLRKRPGTRGACAHLSMALRSATFA